MSCTEFVLPLKLRLNARFNVCGTRLKKFRPNKLKSLIAASNGDSKQSSNENPVSNGQFERVIRQFQKESIGERILGAIANSTAAPMGTYNSEPYTFLHGLDPRVKQAWLIALVVIPMRSNLRTRVAIVAILIYLTMSSLPESVWKEQLLNLSYICGFLFISVAIGTDGAPPLVQPRNPPPSILNIPPLPSPAGMYRYVLFKLGPIQLTRKGLSLALMSCCLTFTFLQSATLCLVSTPPEKMAQSLRWFLFPLKWVGLPLEETILTLLLSLRFVGIVFDEFRNLALGVIARGINWNNLKFLGALDIFVGLIGRLFDNLFNHAEKISEAMVARGYNGNPMDHRTYFVSSLTLRSIDFLALGLLSLIVILVAAFNSGTSAISAVG